MKGVNGVHTHDPFLIALARHELALQRLAEIKVQIGAELSKCPIQIELERLWSSISLPSADHLVDQKGRTKTHLWDAFNYGGLEIDEITQYLADDTGCPHCAKAWDLILERKNARQEAGIAKRIIRYYGKVAIRLTGGDK